jgi:hypothetical protein
MIGYPGKTIRVAVGLVLMQGAFLPGCGPSGAPQPRVIQVPVQTPLDVVRSQLERYVSGQSLDSERELFSTWVNNIRASDPDTADWLGKGFAEIESKPAQIRVIAKQMLERLPR